jgi:hypothetical protein
MTQKCTLSFPILRTWIVEGHGDALTRASRGTNMATSQKCEV